MTIGRVCPKCHYQRKPDDDVSCPEYECPRCGIIYDKFMPPETPPAPHTDGNSTRAAKASSPYPKNSKAFSISGKRIASIALMLIAGFTLYTVFKTSSGSTSDLAGTYTGEAFKDGGRLFVEFDIDKKLRVTRILTKEVQEFGPDGIYELEETILWQYPDISEIRLDFDDDENHSLMFKKTEDECKMEMNDANKGFRVNSTFNIPDSEQSLPEMELKNLPTDESVFYIQFSHHLFNAREIDILREDVRLPERFTFEQIGNYCPVTRTKSDISPLIAHTVQTIYTINVNECKFRLGYSDFRPELKFAVRMENFNPYSQSLPIVDREKINDVLFYTDTNDSPLTLKIPDYRLFSRISLNAKGYGRFGNPYNTETHSLPVSKVGTDLTEEDITNSQDEWETIFIKSDPRYKDGTFKAVQQQRQKAASREMEKMNLAGPEQ